MPSPVLARSGRPIKERIMLYGDSSAGKTYAFLKIAEWHQKRGSDAIFYGMCSTGNNWDRFFMPGGEFEHLENVVTFDLQHIGDYYDVYDKKIKPKARAHDWLCIDTIDDVYYYARDEYAAREWKGKDLGAKWGTEGGEYPITGWEWGPINARYNFFAQNRLMRFAGHVVVLSWDRPLQDAAKSSGKGGERTEVRTLFDLIKVKPSGQWDDFKRFDTIIHLAVSAAGRYGARTARDRGRPLLGEVKTLGKNNTVHIPREINDFFMQYLVRTAGWKL